MLPSWIHLALLGVRWRRPTRDRTSLDANVAIPGGHPSTATTFILPDGRLDQMGQARFDVTRYRFG
jgi:hypothetical protein